MTDHEFRERISKLETTLLLVKIVLGAVVVFLIVRTWGVENPAQIGFIAVLVFAALWALLKVFTWALRRRPGWGDD